MSYPKLVLAVLPLLLAVGGCDDTSNLAAPREFFYKNKIGSSVDYAVIKWRNPDDHVATVHGFADDGATCQQIVTALNADACKEIDGEGCMNPFSCDPLNQ